MPDSSCGGSLVAFTGGIEEHVRLLTAQVFSTLVGMPPGPGVLLNIHGLSGYCTSSSVTVKGGLLWRQIVLETIFATIKYIQSYCE